ncbi:DMT family transporter [Aliikangiella sp. IMCC44359]|uniref:DMT family transporter n=1 Tax=Aliikangiella sp. IMCC44359 TaxID=3459125 RepID=UPI00403B0FA7
MIDKQPKKLIAAIQLIVTMLLVALVTVLAKKTLVDVDSFTFVWLQMLFGIITILIYTFIIKKERLPSLNINYKAWLIILMIGICNFTLVKTLFILSLDILPATTHAYIINFVGIVTMLLSTIFLREVPTKIQLLGALVAMCGIQVYFYIWPGEQINLGLIYAGSAVIFLALTNIFMRLLHLKFPEQLSPNIISTFAIVFGGVPLVSYGLFQSTESIAAISFNNWLVIFFNGMFSIALTTSIFNLVIKQLRAYEASILASTGLIFTAILSIPILDELLKIHQILGCVLLFVGILLVQNHQYKSNR